MFKNYIKTAYRSLLNAKLTSLINIAGLSIGMACCMLILIHVMDELRFNKFNHKLDRIYRVNWVVNDNDGKAIQAITPVPFSNGLAAKIPGIETTARVYQRAGEMQAGNDKNGPGSNAKRFPEQQVYFAENSLFDIFSIPFVAGDKKNALSAVNSIVITDEMAAKYFGTENPVGKSILYENKALLKVTGVVKKMPANSDLKFDFLVSFETFYTVETPPIADFIKNDWTFTPVVTWALLKPAANVSTVERQLKQHLQQNGSDRNRKMNSIELQALNDIHLHAANVEANPSTSNIIYVYIFIGIALLILLIANVNFINLSVARSMNRIREVGIRKVLGAEKKQLIIQFLSETLVTSMISFVFAILLTELGLPLLNQLTDKHIAWFDWVTFPVIMLLLVTFLLTGILAGLYPAFFITRFKMVAAVKGKADGVGKQGAVQKTLLVVQFTVSIILMIGAMVVYQQLQYMRDKPLGFQKHQVVVVPIFGTGASGVETSVDASMRQRMNSFTNKLAGFSKIKAVTAASEMPGQGYIRGLVIPQGRAETDNLFVAWLSVDYNFIDALNIKMAAGRNFSKSRGSDHLNAFILNESAVRSFGWGKPEDAIGKTFVRGKQIDGKKGVIVGVIKDYDFNSLDNPMQPLVIDINVPRFTQFAINIQPDHVDETIRYIKQTWNELFPERVFEYSFLDRDIDAQYKDKENFSKIIEYFAVAAIALSCSGLFSLAFFIVVKRTKEIGIRKVLGANIPTIVTLLSADFIKLVLLSALIAFPCAWLLMNNWLKGFAHRIDIEWWVFALAAFATMLIAFITISFQTIKAALANPVKTLRSE